MASDTWLRTSNSLPAGAWSGSDASYDTRPFAPLSARPPGRSKAHHEKLVAMIRAEEAKLIGHLQTVTRDLELRIAVRKRKRQW